ncbi:MAG: hypothetical protein AAF391_07680 [Bacteroidota bacterium]
MIGAYIEISIMLLGAFLLGMFVTWQYWRKKHRQLQDSHQQLQGTHKQLQNEHEKQKADHGQLANDHEKLEDSHKKLQSDYKKLEEESSKELDASKKKIAELEKKNRAKNKELKEANTRVETLNEEVAVLDDELAAAHDELLAGKEKPRKSTYYRYIDGKRYKAITLKKADKAIEGKGDGRISEEDAREIFSTISDGKRYTPTEKATIRRLRENYQWTEKADKVFRHLVGSWAAHDHNVDEINE